MNYYVTWDDDSFTILNKRTEAITQGNPVVAYRGLLQYVHEVVPNRQGVKIGCRIRSVSDPYWSWNSLNLAMTTVFGFQIQSPLLEVLETCPLDIMRDLYREAHGKELV